MRRNLASLTIIALLSVPLALAQNRDNPYPDTTPGAGPNGSAPNGPGYSNGPAYPNAGGYPNAIAEGTRFIVLLDDKLDTAKLQRGKRFKAKLGDDLMAQDGSIIPHGAKIRGHVSDVEQGLHPRLLLSFDEIESQRGWMPLMATVTGVPGEHGVKQEAGPEGEIERQDVDKRRAAEAVATGAGVGTLAGVAAGGGKGAAIGAATGAGVGLGAGLLADRNFKLQKGTQLEVQLNRTLIVPR